MDKIVCLLKKKIEEIIKIIPIVESKFLTRVELS